MERESVPDYTEALKLPMFSTNTLQMVQLHTYQIYVRVTLQTLLLLRKLMKLDGDVI